MAPGPVVCGWRIERGWLHSMKPAAVPQYLTYTVTDPHGRTWQVSPAINFQISPSSPGQIWQASCAALMTRSPVLSARLVAEHIKDVPA
ncbi:hypothetical protein [Streptomyces sp. 1222.5]|uniref:hypothetical protein n=1 Tax=Streptomyces sp. 1222.5 TaxID=1881026 RepID=UPI003EB7F1A6